MRMDTVIPTKRSAKERLGHDHNPSPIRTVTKQSPPVVKQVSYFSFLFFVFGITPFYSEVSITLLPD